MYISLEAISLIAIHVALCLACAAYAAFLGQDHIYRAYHPRHTFWTVVGGEAFVGIAFALACVFARAWVQAEPLIAVVLFLTLQGVACIPIYRWQRQQGEAEREREKAADARLAKEMHDYGN